MPFGLKNALVFFQQIMDQVLGKANFLKCYIDDILVHSKGFLQHLAHLEELFKRLHEVNMKIHPKKCEFAITSIMKSTCFKEELFIMSLEVKIVWRRWIDEETCTYHNTFIISTTNC
jgi:hypothetical protein